MTHQPYEDWLLDEPNTLLPDQAADLQAHISNCASCRSLSEALGQVEMRLRTDPHMEPAAGFSLRWQERLEVERLRRHRRQTWTALISGLVVLVIMLLLLAVASGPFLQNADDAFWTRVVHSINILGWLQSAGRFLVALLGSIADVLPLVLWIFGIGLVCELGVLWVVSYRLLTNPRRVIA